VKVRKKIDVSGASIWRKQRGQEGGRDEQMGGRKIASKVEAEEKPFCQMHPPFPCLREAVPQQGAWVPADGSCSTGDGVCQVSGSKIKTCVNQRGDNHHIFQSALCVCLCSWLVVKGLPDSRLDRQIGGPVAVGTL